MNRHFWRACTRGAGFSLVELMVTIIIAGIAFAALVPVFVSASKKGSGETARNVALNVAQDRVEKIRQLDYDLLTESNLLSTTFSGGGFGPKATVSGGTAGKEYLVAYSVTFVGGTKDGQPAVVSSTAGDERYKLVQVDVSWVGNPQPVKHAILRTIVYKQYAGSYINVLSAVEIGTGLDPANLSRIFITSYAITLKAYVNEADALNTKYVTFTVFNASGTQIAKYEQATNVLGTYTQPYTIVGELGSQDGTYTFKAVATTKRGYQGNMAVLILPVETDDPPAPTGLAITAGNGRNALVWDQPATGDVVSYEVYRKGPNDDDFGTSRIGTVAVGANSQTAITDTGLTNGQTYSYRIRAVDGVTNRGLYSDVKSGTPFEPPDNVPPNPVTAGSAASAGTQSPPLQIKLSWMGVTDQTSPSPAPTSLMGTYEIYRSDDGGATYPTASLATVADTGGGAVAYTYTDGSNLEPLEAYYYKIVAVDVATNPATTPLTVNATTLNYQYCKVTVFNSNTTTGAGLRVTNPDGNDLDVWPSGHTNPARPTSVNQNEGDAWYLPVGFSFVAWWELNGTSTWYSKPIPAAGSIVNTTPMTISFP